MVGFGHFKSFKTLLHNATSTTMFSFFHIPVKLIFQDRFTPALSVILEMGPDPTRTYF